VKRKNTLSREQFKDNVDPKAEVLALQGEVSRLEGILGQEKTRRGELLNALHDIEEAVPKISMPKMKWKNNTTAPVEQPTPLVVHLTDWHIGQVTVPEYIEEFGENNFAVHEERVLTLGEKILSKLKLQRFGYKVDTCRIIHTADYVSGDIHPELQITNEFPAPVQAVKAGFLLAAHVAMLAPHFKEVICDLLTTDNHGRITRKPQGEQGGLNNYGYVVAHIAKVALSKFSNVEVRIHSGPTTVIEVANQRYLTSHGDGILGTWGIPFYGIERKKQREAMARLNMADDKRFTRLLIGHFHTALNHEHWLIGGSLTGTTAYDHREGRHSLPHQTSWFVHPSKGEFDWSRWFL